MNVPQPSTLLLCAAAFAMLSQLATDACAQPTTGSITGRIFDPSGSVLPNTRIQARNDATGLTQTTISNSTGEYTLAALPPGIYSMELSAVGFAGAVRHDLRLDIDQKIRLDFHLELATVTQSDTVSAGTPLLQTQSAETGEWIPAADIVNLPLLGRNFLDLTKLTAGVTGGGGGNTLNLSVNGQREFANSVLVDGIEVTSNRNNDTTLRPSVDAIAEFRALASGYAPEFGGASGAVIAVESRAGTNQLHGGAYEFFRPNTTTARSFFAAGPSLLKQHNFGATLGGPVRKDKTFFFVSYEGVRLRDSYSFLDSTVPKDQIQFPTNGSVDLAGLKDPYTGAQVPIFDPNFYTANYYAAPFPGNVIPATRVSPAGKAILRNFFPSPEQPGILNGWYENFNSNQAYSFDSDTVSGRIDHILSARDRISGVYHYTSFFSRTGDRFAGRIPVAGGGDADYGDHENSRNQGLSVSETRLLSNTLVNEARFGFTRYRLDQLSLLDGRDLAAQFGQPNVNLPGFPQTSGFPDVYLGFGAQTGGSTYKPLYFLDNNFQISDSIAVRKGRHEWKAGALYRRLTSNPFFSLFPAGFQFYGGPGLSLTSDPNYSFYNASAFYYNGGSDIADLMLGLPYTVNLGQQLTDPHTRSWELGLFVQDSWQLTSRLALFYGIRYEYSAPWTESQDQASNLDLATGQILLAGRGGNSRSLLTPDRNNLAPRLGLAYRLGSRTVLRAGWGVYDSPENDAREDVLTKNYPFAIEQTFFNNIFGGLPFSYVIDQGVARQTSVAVPSGGSAISSAAVVAATGMAQNLFFVDPHLRTGYSELFNATVQRALAGDVVVEAGYVGSVSRKLPYAVGNLNRGNRIASNLGQVQALFSEGSAEYDSLQAKASKRLSRGLTFLAAYTFGKNIDNGPAPFNLGHNLNSHNQPQDPLNLALERAVSDNDVAHNFTLSAVYALPLARRSRLWGGWQVNGIVAARSGLPVNVVRNPQDTGFEGLRPDVTGDPNLPGAQRTLAHYFDTAAFAKARFTGAQKHAIGNAGRNLVRGPGLANLDFSLFKDLPLQERARLQLRFEFFNLTNTPHFANPNGDMSSAGFGSITQTVGNPRICQFAVKLGW